MLLSTLAACAALFAGAGEASAAQKRLFGVATVGDPTPAQVQRAAAGGATTMRVQLSWATIEPTQGVRNWASADAVMASTAAANVRLLPLLYGSPKWVSSNFATPPIYSPQAQSGWFAFVRDFVARYGPGGSFWAVRPDLPPVPIREIQLWNEVNLSYYWGSRPDARGYAELIKLTRGAIDASIPSVKLIPAGLIPFKTTGAGSVPGTRYLQRLFKVKGVRAAIDAVALHPYGASPRIVIKSLEQTREDLDLIGARRLPIWVTEFGWSTGGLYWDSSPFRATPSGQAAKLTQAYRAMRKRVLRKRLRLQRAIYFSLFDYDQAGIEDDWIARMGLFDLNGQPKPAWFAYVRQTGGQP